ncbi:MAG: hypothetical protein VX619_01305 [bacterium]|nr:hypothetical protein [bacterium]
MASKSLNILKIMAFNQRQIEPDYLATYIHFLLEPSEHGLGCRFLHSFLQQIQRTLKGESFFGEILAELKTHVETKTNKLPDQISIFSKLDFDGLPLDLLISGDKFSVLIEIQTDKSRNSRLQDIYRHFIRHHALKVGHRIVCVAVGRDNYLPANFKDNLRQVDRVTFIRFDDQDDAKPSIQAGIINIFHKYGYNFKDDIKHVKDPDYPPGVVLLEDFSQFIKSNMQGYGFQLNPDTVEGITYINSSQLLKKSDGFVYIPNGLSGLLRMRPEHIETFQFGFITHQHTARGWLSVKRVKFYLKWFLSESGNDSKAIISRRTKKRYRRGKCSKY